MLSMRFNPWRHIQAIKDDAVKRRLLEDTANLAHQKFRSGMEASRGGRIYKRRGGRMHRASAPGAWPAVDTGRLKGSIRTEIKPGSMTIGTSAKSDKGAPYSLYLRTGTKKMARRKMSDDALKEAMPIAWARKGRFAKWRVG